MRCNSILVYICVFSQTLLNPLFQRMNFNLYSFRNKILYARMLCNLAMFLYIDMGW